MQRVANKSHQPRFAVGLHVVVWSAAACLTSSGCGDVSVHDIEGIDASVLRTSSTSIPNGDTQIEVWLRVPALHKDRPVEMSVSVGALDVPLEEDFVRCTGLYVANDCAIRAFLTLGVEEASAAFDGVEDLHVTVASGEDSVRLTHAGGMVAPVVTNVPEPLVIGEPVTFDVAPAREWHVDWGVTGGAGDAQVSGRTQACGADGTCRATFSPTDDAPSAGARYEVDAYLFYYLNLPRGSPDAPANTEEAVNDICDVPSCSTYVSWVVPFGVITVP